MASKSKINEDLARERANATIDVENMKSFLGEQYYMDRASYLDAMFHRDNMLKKIKPISDESYNYYNQDRARRYEIVLSKSLEIFEYCMENDADYMLNMYHVSNILGPEKFAFSLHVTMFRDAIEVWSTAEQRKIFHELMRNNAILGTYVQTEIGHGTYLRGMETTATFDKVTQEFVIDCPTLTSVKFWPGGAAYSCNFAIVMAKLVIDGQEHGIHAFLVQLRSLEDHSVMPNLELGDIGKKFGFESHDNAYIKFNQLRIPRLHMLMRFARVTPEGKFERLRSEVLMYAAMLLMRGTVCLLGSFYWTISTTIAIRYSCVRRQTVNAEG